MGNRRLDECCQDKGTNDCSGVVLVVSGPSGSGKTTLVRRLLDEDPELVWSVSATTRSQRVGETDGRDYRFLTRQQFRKDVEAGRFAEHAESYGELYGTPTGPLSKALADGRVIVLDVDVQGARQIRKRFPSAFLVFVMAPSEEELLRRLAERGTEDEEARKKRTERVRQEMSARDEYDRVIVNDDLTEAVGELKEIVAHLKTLRCHRSDDLDERVT